MSTFDISLLVILAAFVFSGLFQGIIRMVGRIIGLIAGIFVASHFYLLVFSWAKNLFGGHDSVGKVVIFIILLVVVTRLIVWLFILIEKIFKFIAVIPGSKYINNILGAVLGFLEGGLFLGTILYVISHYALLGSFFGDNLTNSVVAPFLIMIASVVSPLLPAALTALKSII